VKTSASGYRQVFLCDRKMWSFLTICVLAILVDPSSAKSITRRDTAVAIQREYGDFKENCFPRPSGGCNCNIKNTAGVEEVKKYDEDENCKLPVEVQTVINKAIVTEEINQKFGMFKENCFPKPSGGCSCNEKDAEGNEIVAKYNRDVDCKIPLDTLVNKIHVNQEINQKYGDFKENCFPKPSGGCNCNEKAVNGTDVVKKYELDEQCKVPVNQRTERSTADVQRPVSATVDPYNARDKARPQQQQPASQNVRDPVREKAQQNYQAVLNELHEKFKGLKEGCYPRPKGCLCVVGKDANGRDLTERRMKDSDCKCRDGDTSPGCPVPGA